MAYEIFFSEIAEENQLAFLNHYFQISPKIASKFLEEVDIIVELIKENPFLFGVRYKGIRIANIKKFKTLVCYRIDQQNKAVIVYTIVRSERNPDRYLE